MVNMLAASRRRGSSDFDPDVVVETLSRHAINVSDAAA
jgi:hypothetical protein